MSAQCDAARLFPTFTGRGVVCGPLRKNDGHQQQSTFHVAWAQWVQSTPMSLPVELDLPCSTATKTDVRLMQVRVVAVSECKMDTFCTVAVHLTRFCLQLHVRRCASQCVVHVAGSYQVGSYM